MAIEGAAITPGARARRKLVDHFCAAHAVTPYDTILYSPPADLKLAFDTLLAERLIRKEGHAYYWLDLRAYEAAVELKRRKLVPVVIAVSVLLAVVVMLFYAG
ncbi:hypothetical protein [Sphingomonas koreensis]